MITVVNESRNVIVPSWVNSLDAFRRWLDADDFPDCARVWFLKGNVWVDMSKEQIFSHVQVKTQFNIVVGGLVHYEKSGLFLAEGTRISFWKCANQSFPRFSCGLLVRSCKAPIKHNGHYRTLLAQVHDQTAHVLVNKT